MAERLDLLWESSFDAPSSRDRRSGRYHPHVPDRLCDLPLLVDHTLSQKAASVERAVIDLVSGPGAPGLEGLSRFLLRSEAIASSQIEGLQVSAQQIAMAELAQTEGGTIRGFSENARLVANNITALRTAWTDLAAEPSITPEAIENLHAALLPGHRPAGLREVQNWIGGSGWHPLNADFVPPPPEHVRPLMTDLTDYINGAVHAPLIQAALVHAQFETIHPFTDGNGRVGRALVHTVLARRGLTRVAVLPISVVLLTRSNAYIDGLTAYRYTGAPNTTHATEGIRAWLDTFLDAVTIAVQQASTFAADVANLHTEWEDRISAHRGGSGLRTRPRADSATARLIHVLSEAPMLTTATVQRLLGVSFPAARKAVEELAEAGILTRKSVDKKTTGYLAREVFDLITFAERRLASTRWDTRQTSPTRPTPPLPQRV